MSFKRYKVSVSGKVYDVEVEELSGYPETMTAISRPQGSNAAPQAAPAPVASSNGGTEVKAPLQGIVIGLQAKVGQSVKSGDCLLKIEALKMENEVFSPCDGTVSAVNVKDGDKVSTTDVLVVIS